ncbi:MAG TPA: sugar-binding protein, partial [Gemmatimonadaceae bacterium]|nr:sugar-binding protein [Gemmatimonadaceae bacterium]
MKTLVLFVLFLLPAIIMAQSPAQPENLTSQVVAANGANRSPLDGPAIASRATATSAMATRAVTAPVLDGKTDDLAWRDAQVIDQFLEYEPKKGAETRFKTEVRVTYDDKSLYILARMYDPA